MKAIELLKNAEYQHFQRIPREIMQTTPFEQYWKWCIGGLVELEVHYKFIIGTGAPIDNNSPEFMEALEKEVSTTGVWLYIYWGHDGEFHLNNYETKEEAEQTISEFKDDPYVTSIFILSDV